MHLETPFNITRCTTAFNKVLFHRRILLTLRSSSGKISASLVNRDGTECITCNFKRTRTLQELNFEADLTSTTILKHATDKITYNEEFKWNQFVLRRRIQQPKLADLKQWIKEIAEAHERSLHQGRSSISLSTASDTHQRNFNLNGTRQFHQQPTHPNREQHCQQQPTQNITNFSNKNNQYNLKSK